MPKVHFVNAVQTAPPQDHTYNSQVFEAFVFRPVQYFDGACLRPRGLRNAILGFICVLSAHQAYLRPPSNCTPPTAVDAQSVRVEVRHLGSCDDDADDDDDCDLHWSMQAFLVWIINSSEAGISRSINAPMCQGELQ